VAIKPVQCYYHTESVTRAIIITQPWHRAPHYVTRAEESLRSRALRPKPSRVGEHEAQHRCRWNVSSSAPRTSSYSSCSRRWWSMTGNA